jgi:hypothetical protein
VAIAWFADVEDGEVLEPYRGDRTDMPLIFPLDHGCAAGDHA